MRPLFQADADINQEVVPGPRRREPAVDFQDAMAGGVIGIPDKPSQPDWRPTHSLDPEIRRGARRI